MLTVEQLRNLLNGLDGAAPVRVALVGAEDGHKLLDAVGAHAGDEGVYVKVPSALQAVQAFEADDGSAVIFAFSPED
jgi:hypothetical protein